MGDDKDKPPSHVGTVTPPPHSSESDDTGSLSRGTVSIHQKPKSDPTGSTRRGGYVPTFAPGQVAAGRYTIVRFIAKGGMGEVYEAEDQDLGDHVALKTVRIEMAEHEGAVQRFKREIHLARKVSHPNVCRIFDLGRHKLPPETPGGKEEEILFLTMELLQGETLSQRVKRAGKMKPAEALPVVAQMAAALATAHEAGIVHRDFKSSNVVLVPARSGERAVVTDFGLARGVVDSGRLASLTGTGDILGTPAYMAPEQVESGRVGPAADVYALGVVMYEMVTGMLPFTGESPLSMAVKRLSERPASPRSVAADLDPNWESTILRCLERRPEDRFASAADVVRALGGEAVAAPRKKRRRTAAGVAAAVALALAAGYLLSRAIPTPAPAPSPGAPASAAPAPAVKLRRSIAVLGFKNLGAPETAWLSTAISEMLRTELAAGGKLRTVPGESVTRMKMELALSETDSLAHDTLARIRANIDADLVVLGSYLALGKGDGKIRLDLRLQDTAAGELVASSAAEGTQQEIFALVSQAGGTLREALGLGQVSAMDASALRASFPSSPLAAQLYSEGLAKLRVFDALEARGLLERAAAAEPNHPLVRAALASAWAGLGYDGKARAEAKKAFDLSKDLAREERLTVQALHHETSAEWDKAVDTYKALLVFFPDRLEHGLRLASAQAAAGKGKDGLITIDELRKLPAPASEDPRLDLAEANVAKSLTDFGRQQAAASKAAGKSQKQGARLLYAQARLAEGTAFVNLGRLDEARKACEEAGEIFAAAGDGGNVARSENIIAVAYAMKGDFPNARDRFMAALKAFRQIGDQRGIALQLGNVGGAELRLGNRAQAKKLYEEALHVSREIDDRSGAARQLNNIATVLAESNDLEGARKSYEEALALFRALGEKRNEALALRNIGEALQKQGRHDAAKQSYDSSLAISRTFDKPLAARTLSLLAAVCSEMRDVDAAKKALDEALAIHRAGGDKKGEAAVLRSLGDLSERRGDKAGATALRDQAARIEKQAGGSR
jgi:tetratricopeptide (TPR) repeat protein